MRKYGLIVQFVLALILVILLIVSAFINNIFVYCEILAGILLIIMGINNHIYFKRKKLTLVYAIVGVLVIASAVLTMING